MRAIISRIISMLTGGGSSRRRRTTTTTRRRGMLSRVFSAIKAFFSGGRRRY